MRIILFSFAFAVASFLLVKINLAFGQILNFAECANRRMSQGTVIGSGVDAKCAKNSQGENAIACDPSINACCIDSNGKTVCASVAQLPGFQPAPSDVTKTTPNLKGPLLKIKTLPGIQEAQKPPLTFFPNVPIPGLFEGTLTVNDSLFVKYLSAFYVYFIGVVSILAVVMMMWGGFHYIVSAGNPQRMAQGKETIFAALIGLILALVSFLLLRLINPGLVNFQGIFPRYISQILQPAERLGRPEKGLPVVDALSAEGLNNTANRVKQGGFYQIIQNATGADSELAMRLLALMFVESGGKPDAISQAGACGLIQLLPSTANLSCNQLLDPSVNIVAAAQYFRSLVADPCPTVDQMIKRSIICPSKNSCDKDDVTFAIAAYNGGTGANFCSRTCPGQTWWQCVENEGYDETRQYVYRVQYVLNWLGDSENLAKVR